MSDSLGDGTLSRDGHSSQEGNPQESETDFEQRIDALAQCKLTGNGLAERSERSDRSERSERSDRLERPERRKRRQRRERRDHRARNGFLPAGGKDLRMLHADSPPAHGGKPFSHQMSQLPQPTPAARKRPKAPAADAAEPKSGKPRSMMGMTSRSSKRRREERSARRPRPPRAPRPPSPPSPASPVSPVSPPSPGSQASQISQASQVSRASPTSPPSPASPPSPGSPGPGPQAETYHSQISEDSDRIKIKIRKASSQVQSGACVGAWDVSRKTPRRKRNATPQSCSSGEEYQPVEGAPRPISHPRPRPPRQRTTSKLAALPKVVKPPPEAAESRLLEEPAVERRVRTQQPGPWGCLPEEILSTIFGYLVATEGALPSLIRVSRVCKLWHTASMNPSLWASVELSHHTKDKWKTDHRLVWLLENRLSMCHHLNLSNWKVTDLPWVCSSLVECCPLLRDLNLTGWKRLASKQLQDLALGLPALARLDLSCTSDTGSSASCLSVSSMTAMTQTMADRLTHFTLANNKLTGLPMILNAIAAHCPSLELLDLSNLAAVSHPAVVPLERLQKGCPQLRVLRITNSQVVLANSTTQEQMESPGFPLLEELSVACPSTDYKLVDDEALGRILKGSTCLRLLDVRGCIRITDSGLIKVPAWDLQHLFLSGCCVTRQSSSCLELICEKWSHSLLEVDLAWSTATQPLDAAVEALADKGAQSKLRILNLCGSSVSFDPVKVILLKCPNLESVNLASCRALPRGMKRLYTGKELDDLRDSLDPVKKKEKEEAERLAKEKKKKTQEENRLKQEEAKKRAEEAKSKLSDADKSPLKDTFKGDSFEMDDNKTSIKSPSSMVGSPTVILASPSVSKVSDCDLTPQSVERDSPGNATQNFSPAPKGSSSMHEPFSPQQSTSAISTPRSNIQEFSPVGSRTMADPVSASNQGDSDSRQESSRAGGWNLGQFSPLTKREGLASSQPSPDPGLMRQDAPKGGDWNLGHYSPSVPRQESPYSQKSPYSSQKSPYSSRKSPDVSASKQSQPGQSGWNLEQFSPVMRQESASSSQPSPEAAQAASRSGNWNLERFSPMPSAMMPSPDTSQVTSSGKPCAWNLDRFSPMTRAESSPAPVPSPETGPKAGQSWNLGQFSPMARTDVSPAGQPSPEMQSGPKSGWNLGHFSPMARQDASPAGQPSPKAAHSGRNLGQFSPMGKVDSSSSQRAGGDPPSMWGGAGPPYPLRDSSALKSDSERTGMDLGNGDQVTTTTYCSSAEQGVFRGYRDPVNGPS